jgi:hypothetical protein
MATINRRVMAKIEGDFVVFIIGMRVNKPWKLNKWLPVFMAMPPMLAELEKNPDSGFLGAEQFINPFKPVLVQYWRSFEALEKYSRDAAASHWPAWQKFNKSVGSNGDVGIWHETYKVAAGQYECVYNNMPPTGLLKASAHADVGAGTESAAERMGATS